MNLKAYDPLLFEIASYVDTPINFSDEVRHIGLLALMDALGCAILSLNFSDCKKLLGPEIPGTYVPNGVRVIGTPFVLDPVTAAFNLGIMIRWLDFNDTWLAKEWGHPSDNIAGILSAFDYISQMKVQSFTVQDVVEAMIKAYEIQGILALSNSFNEIGFDHVILVKIATAAVVTKILGGSLENILDALSQAFVDGAPLRTYRHYPNTGSRKSWAAGDASARGLFFGLLTLKGETGYPSCLTTKHWGFNEVIFRGKSLTLTRPLHSYVMENILFKIAYPAEFHAQTAVEAAVLLHPQVKGRLNDIVKIEIETHAAAIKIIDKKGPLKNPADRDHCLQYMVAVSLIKGQLAAEDYLEKAALNPLIDILREKMVVNESKQFSIDYLDENKRSIANAVTIYFKDGDRLGPVVVEYPLGHKRRRKEGEELIFRKFENNISKQFQDPALINFFKDPHRALATSLREFLKISTKPCA
jgi:2-methylcitrate dehydratase